MKTADYGSHVAPGARLEEPNRHAWPREQSGEPGDREPDAVAAHDMRPPAQGVRRTDEEAHQATVDHRRDGDAVPVVEVGRKVPGQEPPAERGEEAVREGNGVQVGGGGEIVRVQGGEPGVAPWVRNEGRTHAGNLRHSVGECEDRAATLRHTVVELGAPGSPPRSARRAGVLEVDRRGDVVRRSRHTPPVAGDDIVLTIDAAVQAGRRLVAGPTRLPPIRQRVVAFAAVLAAISYEPLVRIELGPVTVSPHGIFTAVGFLLGARLLLVDTRRRGIPDEDVYAILTRAAIGALVGARLVYVLNHLSSYDSPLEWLKVWEGGISLLGGIAGAIVAALPVFRRLGVRFFPLMDLVAPWLPLGIAVGRVGDLIIADHLGAPTDLPFGFRCPDVVDVGRTVGSPCPPGEVVHLTAAYDLLIAGGVSLVLVLLRRVPLRLGERTLLLGILYGAGRFAFDFLREDTRRFGLTGSQMTAGAVIVVATALLVWRRRHGDLPLIRTDRPEPGTEGPGEGEMPVDDERRSPAPS